MLSWFKKTIHLQGAQKRSKLKSYKKTLFWLTKSYRNRPWATWKFKVPYVFFLLNICHLQKFRQESLHCYICIHISGHFTNLDFPEISWFPLLFATFLGACFRSQANLTRYVMASELRPPIVYRGFFFDQAHQPPVFFPKNTGLDVWAQNWRDCIPWIALPFFICKRSQWNLFYLTLIWKFMFSTKWAPSQSF